MDDFIPEQFKNLEWLGDLFILLINLFETSTPKQTQGEETGAEARGTQSSANSSTATTSTTRPEAETESFWGDLGTAVLSFLDLVDAATN